MPTDKTLEKYSYLLEDVEFLMKMGLDWFEISRRFSTTPNKLSSRMRSAIKALGRDDLKDAMLECARVEARSYIRVGKNERGEPLPDNRDWSELMV